jgi:hypothetical protein
LARASTKEAWESQKPICKTSKTIQSGGSILSLDDAWIAFAIVEESKLPPLMPNRTRFRTLLQMDRQLKKAIPIQLLKDAVSSTILKTSFAKESFQQLKKIDLQFSATISNMKEIPEVKMRINLKNYLRLVRELDSLMFELYGSLDYFSKEIDIVLGLGLKDTVCSFREVTKALEKRGGNDELRRMTLELSNSEWFEYLRSLRHRLTHRSGIILFFSEHEPYFPDDPLSEPESTDKQMRVVPTCQIWLEKSMGYIEEATRCLCESLFSEW